MAAEDKYPALGGKPEGGANASLIYPKLIRPVFSDKDPDKHDFDLRVEQSDDEEVDPGYKEPKDELFDTPSCSGVAEWFNCLLFDVILLLLEAGVAIWLARSLYPLELITEYRTILVVLALPSFINPFLWLKIKSSKSSHGFYYQNMGTFFVFGLLFASFNSPFFVYVWHLYLSALGSRQSAANSRKLANTFRMVQAIITSVPLLVLNLTTLVSMLKSDEGGVDILDLRLLSAHLSEVEIHGLAFFISLLNLIRAASLFNERQTFTVLFSIIALPFLILTIYSRLMALAIILAFLEGQWVAVLFITLFFVNILLYVLCRKRSKVVKRDSDLRPIRGASSGSTNEGSTQTSQTDDDLIQSADNCSEDSGHCCLSSCCTGKNSRGHQSPLNTSHRSGKYNVSTGTYYKSSGLGGKHQKNLAPSGSCWMDLPKVVGMSIGSIIVPVGYSSDFRLHHLRIKGGIFLIANYISHMVLIGLALGYTIQHKIPNSIQGLKISNPSIDVQIPSSKIHIGAFGVGLGLSMPNQKMNLGSMPAMNASINTEALDSALAVLVPIVLAIFCLPFAIMRASMMELDCFITHKKELDSFEENVLAGSRRDKRRTNNVAGNSLMETVLRNSESPNLKCRMYLSLCCGLCGVFIFTMFAMIAGALAFLAMH